jgi:hypothetical protein
MTKRSDELGEMKTRHDKTSSELVLRFAADRVCAWSICGDASCLRARTCRGDRHRCAALLGGWLEAIEEEQRAHGDLAALEDSLHTMQEVNTFRAWRKALHRTKTQSRQEAAEVEQLRQDLLRRFNAMIQTAEYEQRQQELRAADGEAKA